MKMIIRLLLVSVPIALCICVLAQIVVANQMIVYGSKLTAIDRRIDELTEQNDVLKKRVAQLSSIRWLAHEAKQGGYVEGKNYIAFDTDHFPVALKR